MYIYVLHCTSLCNINHGEPILSEEMAVSSPHFEWTNTTHIQYLLCCTVLLHFFIYKNRQRKVVSPWLFEHRNIALSLSIQHPHNSHQLWRRSICVCVFWIRRWRHLRRAIISPKEGLLSGLLHNKVTKVI